MNKQQYEITVNGKTLNVSAYPMARLLDVLREDLNFTGTKEGCGEGECGACSVLFDGKVVNSCLIPIVQAQNKNITTIECESNAIINTLQEEFIEWGGAQCGICTPGMIIAAAEILQKNPKPSRDEIIQGLGGNLCRCTGYTKIIDSIEKAAERL